MAGSGEACPERRRWKSPRLYILKRTSFSGRFFCARNARNGGERRSLSRAEAREVSPPVQRGKPTFRSFFILAQHRYNRISGFHTIYFFIKTVLKPIELNTIKFG
jgi:hypothetical protein